MAARDGEQVEAGEWKSVNLGKVRTFLGEMTLYTCWQLKLNFTEGKSIENIQSFILKGYITHNLSCAVQALEIIYDIKKVR